MNDAPARNPHNLTSWTDRELETELAALFADDPHLAAIWKEWMARQLARMRAIV
jgi:hypothetical protein